MKKTFIPALLVLCCLSTIAGNISDKDAVRVAECFNKKNSIELFAVSASPLVSLNDTIAWIVNCNPKGFVLVPAENTLPPVIGWSAEADFGEGDTWFWFKPSLIRMIQSLKPSENNPGKWDDLLEGKATASQQWPPEGWSSTGGWLFTNWTQTGPYNNFCPVDGSTGVRSVAGCPATAMAQIVNFHKQVHNTRFGDSDDYYHNFGSNNNYMIDDDWASFGFPSFDQLNIYLDTLEYHYQHGIDLSDDDMAALTFACGVAAHQVFSSSVSGTYGISQAFEAFVRFQYNDAVLVYPTDPSLNNHLAENMKAALPAHLGLVDPGVTVGHNVVVDGFSTDSLYHFNFGWGGSANGWYTMPPSSIPYNLTVIEGVVMDINLSGPPAGIASSDNNTQVLFYNSSEEKIIIKGNIPEKGTRFYITDISGRSIFYGIPDQNQLINVSFLKPGFYAVFLSSGAGLKFIKM